jgi:hypothetical protein
MEWFLVQLALTIVFAVVTALAIVLYLVVPVFFIWLIYLIIKGLGNGK